MYAMDLFCSDEEAKSSDCKRSENISKKATTALPIKNEPPPMQTISPQQSQSTEADSTDAGKKALLEGLSAIALVSAHNEQLKVAVHTCDVL